MPFADVRNRIKLTSLVISLAVLTLFSSCKTGGSGSQMTVAPAAVQPPNKQFSPIPTAEEVFHLRSECAQLGEKLLEKKKKEDMAGNDDWSQSSHYDPETNRCYVEITTVTADRSDPHFQGFDELYDGQTGEELATVISQGRNCPANPCNTSGVVYDVHHKKISNSFSSTEDAREYIYDMMYDKRDK